MDKLKQQFEDYCKSADLPTEIFNGNYNYNATRIAWEAWQASRDSLEVELPRKHDVDDEYDYFAMGYNLALNKIHDLLVEEGVKVK